MSNGNKFSDPQLEEVGRQINQVRFHCQYHIVKWMPNRDIRQINSIQRQETIMLEYHWSHKNDSDSSPRGVFLNMLHIQG